MQSEFYIATRIGEGVEGIEPCGVLGLQAFSNLDLFCLKILT